MSDARDLLIEIGTEELPPKALFDLALAFEKGVCDGLEKAGLSVREIRRFATPRRLAAMRCSAPATLTRRASGWRRCSARTGWKPKVVPGRVLMPATTGLPDSGCR